MLTRAIVFVLFLGIPVLLTAEQVPVSPFQPLLEMSQNEKKGLVFYVKGTTIPGIVREIHENGVVEVANRQYGTILILLEQVDAVASY